MQRDPFELDAATAASVRAALLEAWRAIDGEPGEVDADLQVLTSWFGPAATPAAVRRRLNAVPTRQEDHELLWTRFDPPLGLDVDGRTIVTPEGRLALEVLREAEGDSEPIRLAVGRDRRLIDLYRGWALERVRAVGARRSGQVRRAERPPAVGLVVLLLLYGADSRDRALVVDRSDRSLEEALRELLADFAQGLSGRPSQLREPIWKFPIVCAQRRFAAVRRETNGRVERFWVEAAQIEELLDALAEELIVVRRDGSPQQANAAVRSLADAYERHSHSQFDRPLCGELLDELTARFVAAPG